MQQPIIIQKKSKHAKENNKKISLSKVTIT